MIKITLLEEFLKISGAVRNRGKWSDIIAIRLPDIIGWYNVRKNVINTSLWVGSYTCWLDVKRNISCMNERNIDEVRESKNALVGECFSIFKRSTL